MYSQLKRRLPVVAVIAGVAAVILIAVFANLVASQQRELGAILQSVQKTLASLEALRPASIEDAAFRDAVKQTLKAPHVVSVWLFAPDGRIVSSEGAGTTSRDRVQELVTSDTLRGLHAFHKGDPSEIDWVAVMALSAMPREGEHNEVFLPYVQAIRGPSGSYVALVGVAYEVSDVLRNSGPGPIAAMLGFYLAAPIYWLSLPLWVFLDARERRERALAWGIFVLIGNLVALLAYLLATSRPAGGSSAA
jgi:hypothetical protein